MSSDGLVLFDDDSSEDEGENVYLESNEDPEYLQKLKIVSQSFLRVNGFDLGDEPNYNDLSIDQFVDYIKKKSSKDEDKILKTISNRQINIETNLRVMLSKIYQHKTKKNTRILVYFLPDVTERKTINNTAITGLVDLMKNLNCQEGLMISKKDLIQEAKEKIRQINIDPGDLEGIYNITVYQDDDFIDISGHSFIPEIISIMRGTEKEKFSKDNRLDVQKLPKLLSNDPMVKFYRGIPGDVFKLKRQIINEKNMLDYQIIYRIVVRKYI